MEASAQCVRDHRQRPDHPDRQLTNAKVRSTVNRTVPQQPQTGRSSAGALQRGERLSDREELVAAELANGLDGEGLVEMLGVGVGDASQRRGRRIEDLLQRLVLVGLVECLGQVDGYRHGSLQTLT